MLRHASLLLGSLALIGCTCTDQSLTPRSSPELGARAYTHIANLVAFGARHTGSPGWRKGISYIQEQIRAMGLEPQVDSWEDSVEKLTFSNVSVVLPGTSEDRIVVACHHDTKKCHGHADPEHNFIFVGANDSGSGVGMLLELIRVLKDQTHKGTYEFVFFDGEESLSFDWNIKRALFGSRHYVRRYKQRRLDNPQSPVIRALILVDMVGATDLQIDEDTNSDAELRQLLFAAAKAAGHSKLFFQSSLAVVDDHIPFRKESIPCVDVIDIDNNPQWHTADDTLEHVSPVSLQKVGDVLLTLLPAVEARYIR